MKLVYVWNGSSIPLEGKIYAKGEEIPLEVVDGLRSKKALLSIGRIKLVTVEEDKVSSAPTKKTAEKKTAKKKVSAPKKTTKKKTTKPVKKSTNDELVDGGKTAPEEE